jgi:hypothetical protein
MAMTTCEMQLSSSTNREKLCGQPKMRKLTPIRDPFAVPSWFGSSTCKSKKEKRGRGRQGRHMEIHTPTDDRKRGTFKPRVSPPVRSLSPVCLPSRRPVYTC